MSEAQKSAMGPRRLLILLALGAVVFYFLSDGGEVKESEENISNTEAEKDLDLVNDSTTPTFEEEVINSANNKKKSVKTSIPQTSEEGDVYSPQSTDNSDDQTPQSSVNNDSYTPQSVKVE